MLLLASLGNINSPRSGGRSFHTICVGAASGNNDVRHTFDSCNVSILGIIIIAIIIAIIVVIIFVIVDVTMSNEEKSSCSLHLRLMQRQHPLSPIIVFVKTILKNM